MSCIRDGFEYDVALSFAGENRSFVEAVARCLVSGGAAVFYDHFEQGNLLGKDLYQYFQRIYIHRARYCVVFVSEHYANKLWTNLELKQAQARVFVDQRDYLLPVRFDDIPIPGVNRTIAYLDARTTDPEGVANAILERLFHKSHKKFKLP